MIVRDPRQTWKYVLSAERSLPREEQTVWHLKHLTLAEEHKTLDNMDRDSFGFGIRREAGTEQLYVLRRNLIGWENLKRADGTVVPFEAGSLGGAKDDLLNLLPLSVRVELAKAIEAEIAHDPDELGKS